MHTMKSAPIGLVIRRSPRQLASEPFYSELIAGVEEAIAPRDLQVLMYVVDDMQAELDTYRRWAADGTVCALVLVDFVPDDPRPALVAELQLPAVVLGEPGIDLGLPSVRTENYAAMRYAVDQLAGLGHRRIGHVTGIVSLFHTQERSRAFVDATNALGLEARTEEGDYSHDSGRRATTQLMMLPISPTALIYDNDVMAVAGLEAARDLGIAVPAALSLVAWDDSQLCRLTDPPLSALNRDAHAYGVLTADVLLEVLDGNTRASVTAPNPVFVARGSTAEFVSTISTPGQE